MTWTVASQTASTDSCAVLNVSNVDVTLAATTDDPRAQPADLGFFAQVPCSEGGIVIKNVPPAVDLLGLHGGMTTYVPANEAVSFNFVYDNSGW